MNLKDKKETNVEDDYIICLSKSEYISIKNTLNAMTRMFLSMPTHRKANKEKANVLKDILSKKFND